MKNNRPTATNAVVMAGMATAVAVVLSMIGLYVPVISTFIFLAIPLPMIYVAITQGSRWAVLVSVGTLILDSVFFGILSGAFLCAVFTVLGVTLGFCYEKQIRPLTTLLAGAASVLLSFTAVLYFSVSVLGMESAFLSAAFYESVETKTIDMISQVYSGEMLEDAKQQFALMCDLLRKCVCFTVAVIAFVYSYGAMALSQAMFRRMGITNIPTLPPVSRWEFPVGLVYIYLLSVGIEHFVPIDEIFGIVLANINMICLFIFWLQGLSFLWWSPKCYPAMASFRWIIVVLAFLIPIVLNAMIVAGLFDLLFHYRAKRNYE